MRRHRVLSGAPQLHRDSHPCQALRRKGEPERGGSDHGCSDPVVPAMRRGRCLEELPLGKHRRRGRACELRRMLLTVSHQAREVGSATQCHEPGEPASRETEKADAMAVDRVVRRPAGEHEVQGTCDVPDPVEHRRSAPAVGMSVAEMGRRDHNEAGDGKRQCGFVVAPGGSSRTVRHHHQRQVLADHRRIERNSLRERA